MSICPALRPIEKLIQRGGYTLAQILVVDDDPDILSLISQLLASAHHDVVTTKSAMGAVELLERHSFDLVITDANMPRYSGFDLLKTLRKHPRYSSLPVAMLTGRREKKDIERALGLGVNDYIVKPLDPFLFLQKIESLLQLNPQTQGTEIPVVAHAPAAAQAIVSIKVDLRSISELGMVLVGEQSFTVGALLHMTSGIFDEIGIEAPVMKVLSSIPVQEGKDEFETRLMFVGANDSTLQKVRAWVFRTVTQNSRQSA
jgi:CheY-like chemotaxis protein